MYNINSVFFYFFYFKLNSIFYEKSFKFIYKSTLKLNFNFFILSKKTFFKKYYYFFDYFINSNNFFFIKCFNLLLHNYLYKYINIIYNLTSIGMNFFFLSTNTYFNFFWNFNINFFLKNFTKNNFSRFLVNFLRKNSIKLLIFLDTKFLYFLPFFKRIGFLTSGFLFNSNNLQLLDLPLFFNGFYNFSKYFIFNLTYKVYLMSLMWKYNKLCLKYLNNSSNLSNVKTLL